jgi:hypothetical protein
MGHGPYLRHGSGKDLVAGLAEIPDSRQASLIDSPASSLDANSRRAPIANSPCNGQPRGQSCDCAQCRAAQRFPQPQRRVASVEATRPGRRPATGCLCSTKWASRFASQYAVSRFNRCRAMAKVGKLGLSGVMNSALPLPIGRRDVVTATGSDTRARAARSGRTRGDRLRNARFEAMIDAAKRAV